jgi:hypothetical protein
MPVLLGSLPLVNQEAILDYSSILANLLYLFSVN